MTFHACCFAVIFFLSPRFQILYTYDIFSFKKKFILMKQAIFWIDQVLRFFMDI